MLGSEPERPNHEPHPVHNHSAARPGSVMGTGMAVSALMSSPQQPPRHAYNDYPYKREQTPEKLNAMFQGNRQRSSSSGSSMLLNRQFHDHYDRYSKPPAPTFHAAPPFMINGPSREEQEERARRTSLSGILQRPSSQPHASALLHQSQRSIDHLTPQHPNWYAEPPPPSHDATQRNGISNTYDTKPPGFREHPRPLPHTQPSPTMQPPQPISPEIRRISNGSYNRGFATLLNGPTSQPAEHLAHHGMVRQDSTQSQTDSSMYGERRFRHFSPHPGSNAHLTRPGDDLLRKGSDEISHKAILGLGLENRRGRYSPVPQAVQGAQAPTPVPDGGNPRDQGKVFSGIGGGISTVAPTSASASPFKRDDSVVKTLDATKMSRATSTTGKRTRKMQEEEQLVDDTKTSTTTKRRRYKTDLLKEAAATPYQRKGTPTAGLSTSKSAASATTAAPMSGLRTEAVSNFKSKKTIKVATIVSQVLRRPRRHLGSFQYAPRLLVSDEARPAESETAIRVVPNMLPAFSEAEDLNCIYTINVSKTWLPDRERRLICASRNLWGSGIYTDDTDPVAAAMHMGWIKPAFHNVDEALLQKIIHDQNPKVEISKDLKPPSKPIDIKKSRDLKITCVVMPLLERYEDSARFGIRSRSWPETPLGPPHDGVSFSILKVEAVDTGREERRMGRTGVSKRARLKEQLLARERAKEAEKERIARAAKTLKDKNYKQKREEIERKKARAGKVPSPLSNEIRLNDEVVTAPVQAEDEWRRQLATAAA